MMDQVDKDYSGEIELSEFVMFMVIFKRDHAHKAPDHGPNGAVVPRTKGAGGAGGAGGAEKEREPSRAAETKDADEEVAAFDDEKQMKQGGAGGGALVYLEEAPAAAAAAAAAAAEA
jgi:hypothetical protein